MNFEYSESPSSTLDNTVEVKVTTTQGREATITTTNNNQLLLLIGTTSYRSIGNEINTIFTFSVIKRCYTSYIVEEKSTTGCTLKFTESLVGENLEFVIDNSNSALIQSLMKRIALLEASDERHSLELDHIKEQINNQGWIILMKAAGTDLSYESSHFIEDTTLNPHENNKDFKGISAKFKEFNTEKVNELRLITSTGCTSHLRFPDINTMLNRFKSGTTQKLELISGKDPLSLINGVDSSNYLVKNSPAWRLNLYSNTTPKFRARLGGFFTHHWQANYGVDSLGFPGTAEICGVGISDEVYSPYQFAKKSFGVRQAHDFNDLPLGGQTVGEVHIYGRLKL